TDGHRQVVLDAHVTMRLGQKRNRLHAQIREIARYWPSAKSLRPFWRTAERSDRRQWAGQIFPPGYRLLDAYGILAGVPCCGSGKLPKQGQASHRISSGRQTRTPRGGEDRLVRL